MGQCRICHICGEKEEEITSGKITNQAKTAEGENINSIESDYQNQIIQANFQINDKKKFEEEINTSNLNLTSQHSRMSIACPALSITKKLFIKEQKDTPESKYRKIKGLGSGSYGFVYLAENLLTKEKVAIKKIDKTSDNILSEKEIINEIEILKSLDHPNIVRLTEFYNTNESYYLVNEYCPGGELCDQPFEEFSETQIAVIIKQILSGLAYMHYHDIFHRNLKLEHILINDKEVSDKNGEELFNVRIIDFGSARINESNKKEYALVGTAHYMAPEVLNREYNKECDLWSVGVILYTLIVGHEPFEGDDKKEIFAKIKEGIYPKDEEKWINSSEEVRDLIQKLLVINPKERLTAIQALKHKWFQVANSEILDLNISKEQVQDTIKLLLSYQVKTKFEELVLAYIIHNMPKPDEAKIAIKIFKLANKNGDGQLQKDELKETLLNFVSEDFLKNYDKKFSKLDGDNNGYIDYQEFLRATLDKKKFLTDENLHRAFDYFDKEKSGFITKEKVKEAFAGSKASNVIYDKIFNQIDIDQNNKIDFDEFKQMLLY